MLQHGADVLAVAFSPDGSMLAAATLDGAIALWDARDASQVASIDGRSDVAGGRSVLSKVSSKNSHGSKCFRSLCFSADGGALLSGPRRTKTRKVGAEVVRLAGQPQLVVVNNPTSD